MPTAKQVAMLHVAKKQLGLDDETYRSILKKVGGAESAAELDRYGYEEALAEFKRLGFRATSPNRSFGLRRGMATPEQVGLIRKLWTEWAAGEEPEKGLDAWLERSFHVSALRFLPADKAGKAINGLRAMLRRKAGPAA
ncbi:uncharacterized protein DUF1018 [Methylosinus sp. sav-2]|uniref:regulatory protein GemA n=1 Tax=Methylosinus sp. sav-2 TaxID=2485168 RepID=UPI00047E5B03|nr:regulatory protein GemA [Methylosinus sp. sav-2]TDX60780.1 uncharacterized protein DUF1018 [Methylosinus sp. sav-2]